MPPDDDASFRTETLAPGLERWEALHPSWRKVVGCVLLEGSDGLVLVDPLAPPDGDAAAAFWAWLDRRVEASGRVDVVLTLHYHRRSAAAVVGRYPGRAALWVPEGSERRLGGARPDRVFAPGEALPGGLEAHRAGTPGEVVLHAPAQRALVAGDVLLGGVRRPLRVCPRSWLPASTTRAEVARALAPLLELPLDLVVPLHGPPVVDGARAALEAALAEAARA